MMQEQDAIAVGTVTAVDESPQGGIAIQWSSGKEEEIAKTLATHVLQAITPQDYRL